MQSLYASGLFDKCIYLGDNADVRTIENFESWKTANADVLPYSLVIAGNHDGGGASEFREWWRDEVFSSMPGAVFDAEATTYHNEYFYYDNAAAKIRLIFVCATMSSDENRQRAWIKETVASVPSDWTYFVLSHEYQVPLIIPGHTLSYDDIFGAYSSFGAEVMLDSRFGAFFCGHHHNDIDCIWCGNLHNTTFLTDSYTSAGGANGSYSVLPSRNANDNTSQAVTIVSINPQTKNVKFYRIGQVDTATVNWQDKKHEYTYGAQPSGILDDRWIGSDGGFSKQDGAKVFLEPIEVDPSKTHYIVHEDGTDVRQNKSTYLYNEFDASGRFLGRCAYGTIVSSKAIRASLRSNTKYIIRASWYGDEYILSERKP